MAEFERTKQRERGPLEETPYEKVLRYRAEQEERNKNGPIVIKRAKRKVHQSRQGRTQRMLDPAIYEETPLQMWRIFTHEVKTRSGKHRHQGGIIIYVIKGNGYSIVDGERKDWKKGDLMLLPMKPEGVEHQHFNLGGAEDPAVWAAFIHIPIIEHLASELKQVENSPDFTD